MGYIMNFREKVGHDPLIGVGATTLVFNNKNELLPNLRNDTNNWGIPGGSKELNETLKECAIRELKVELLRYNDMSKTYSLAKLSLYAF